MLKLPVFPLAVLLIIGLIGCHYVRDESHWDIEMAYNSTVSVPDVSYKNGQVTMFNQVVAIKPCKVVKIKVEKLDSTRTGKVWADDVLVLDYKDETH